MKVITRVRGQSTHVFVKTSSRSAKDATILVDSFTNDYRKQLKYLIHEQKQPDNLNNRLIALLQVATNQLKISSAREALWMFVHSERIAQDMRIALELPERFQENIVVRRWVDIDVGENGDVVDSW